MTQDARAVCRSTIAGIILFTGMAWLGTFASSAQSAERSEADASAAGQWVGSAEMNGNQIPFRLDISGSGDQVRAALVNGKEESPASSGSFSGGHLVLHFDYYANTLDASLKDGVLSGTFGGHSHTVPLIARLNGQGPLPSADPPNVAGEWEVAVESSKGEHAWKLKVKQSGPDVQAVIERIDGDTGTLYGVWRDGRFAVSHFTAAGPSYAVIEPGEDGTLQLLTPALGGAVQQLTARRPKDARTKSLSGPDDPLTHTSLKNPNEPLVFQFPDVSGKVVSSTDPEFRGKVLILSIGGSWCPNCQDEAPFLEELYRKFHGQGLAAISHTFRFCGEPRSAAGLRSHSTARNRLRDRVVGVAEELIADRSRSWRIAPPGCCPTCVEKGCWVAAESFSSAARRRPLRRFASKDRLSSVPATRAVR